MSDISRWQSFSDKELRLLDLCIECSSRYDKELDTLQNGIEAELHIRGIDLDMREWPEVVPVASVEN
jgi:hypothetical protein